MRKLTCILGKLQLNYSKSKISSNKRKHNFTKSLSRCPPKEARIGEQPLVVIHLSWDWYSKILVHILPDSGTQIFTISEAIVRKYRIPCWSRQVSLKLNNFVEESVLEVGWQYIRPFCIRHQQHYNNQAFEVSPMEPSFDMVLPH